MREQPQLAPFDLKEYSGLTEFLSEKSSVGQPVEKIHFTSCIHNLIIVTLITYLTTSVNFSLLMGESCSFPDSASSIQGVSVGFIPAHDYILS